MGSSPASRSTSTPRSRGPRSGSCSTPRSARRSAVPDVNLTPEESRYEITRDGQLAGFSQYRGTETEGTAQRILFHTEVGKAFGGRGLASALTREAIGQAVSEGKRVVPMCSYVQ